MLLPTHLLPEAFGVAWGFSQMQCQVVLTSSINRTGENFMAATSVVAGEERDVVLSFDGAGPGCITVYSHESRDFYEGYDEDERDAVNEHFYGIFDSLVAASSEILGPPDFSRHTIDYEWGDLPGQGYTE